MIHRLVLLGLVGGALAGCTDDVAQELHTGTYSLIRSSGQVLPINEGPLPRRCGPGQPDCDPFAPPHCYIITTEGALSLDPERGRYDTYIVRRASCGAHVLDNTGISGSYEQNGDLLTFQVHRIDGTITNFGRVEDDAIVLTYDADEINVYDMSPLPLAPPELSGTFSLVEVINELLPIPGADGASQDPLTCRVTAQDGALSLTPKPGLEPATGTFTLGYSLGSTCPDQQPQTDEASGTYEQVANSLVFFAPTGPNSFREYRGVIGETEIVLRGGGANDLIFRL